MRHREVRELMTRKAITVPPNAAFKDIVRTLTERQVSAVPVVDAAGRPLGVISERDLLAKSADQGEYFRSLPARESWEQDKAEALRAEELMSAPAVCAKPDWTVARSRQADGSTSRRPTGPPVRHTSARCRCTSSTPRSGRRPTRSRSPSLTCGAVGRMRTTGGHHPRLPDRVGETEDEGGGRERPG